MNRRAIISLVEDGWRSARMLSLSVARELGGETVHYVKGVVEPWVLGMITPCPGVRITPVPRPWFRVVSGWLLVSGFLRRRWQAVVVDKPDTRRWVTALARGWRVPVIEAGERFQQLMYHWDGETLTHAQLLQRLRKETDTCASRSSLTAHAMTPAAPTSSGR